VPKHVFHNVQSKSRWWKKDFGSKSAIIFKKHVQETPEYVFFGEFCWFGPKIFLPPSWFWLDIFEDMFRHSLPYTLKFFKNMLPYEIIFWKLQLQISGLDLWPARLLTWAKLKRTSKLNFSENHKSLAQFFQLLWSFFGFFKNPENSRFWSEISMRGFFVLWPSWHCWENFKVVTQTFATVQLVLIFTWKRPSNIFSAFWLHHLSLFEFGCYLYWNVKWWICALKVILWLKKINKKLHESKIMFSLNIIYNQNSEICAHQDRSPITLQSIYS
jgi:hypothetical protein